MSELLTLEPALLAANLDKAPFEVHHELADHPLLTLDALGDLADSLPPDQFEHNLGDVPTLNPDGEAPTLDMPPGEIVRGVETNHCWMVLKLVESDPAYRQLLEDTLSSTMALVSDREGGVRREEAFIFVSASNSTTPVHFDPEHNFLLQVRGNKEITIGSHPDAEVEERSVERYYGGAHRNIELMPADPKSFKLEPGDGVYVPIHAPHWVKSGGDVSISFSVTFYTGDSERRAMVYQVNSRLRRLHVSPAPPGRRPAVDRAKAGAWRASRSVVRTARRALSRGS